MSAEGFQGARASASPREPQRRRHLAVVVVTYCSSDVLPGFLASLPAALEGLDVTVVAVDNASDDATVDLLSRASVVDRIVELPSNSGYSAGVNAGANAIEGWDALLVLNPDLRPQPGLAAKLWASERAGHVGIFAPMLRDADGSSGWSLRREPSAARAWAEAFLGGRRAAIRGWGELIAPADADGSERVSGDLGPDWVTGAALMITRACWDDVGPWDETFFLYGEEADFILRARDRGWLLHVVPDARAVHLRGDAPRDPRLWSLLQRNRLKLVRARCGPLRSASFHAALLANAALRSWRPTHRRALRALLPGGGRHVVSGAGGPRGRPGSSPSPQDELASRRVGQPQRRGQRRRRRERRRSGRRRRVLIVVQNLPVPMDRRVWQEARALVEAGLGVSVICPRGPGEPLHEVREGVRLHRYPAPPATRGALSYVIEFAYCWLATALWSAIVWTRHGFGIIQACNPPDTYFALAALYRPMGVPFVFDQHDLCPEVYQSRFGDSSSAWYRGLHTLERATYRRADHVISPNESYARTAMRRGALDPAAVTVVRNGPDLSVMRPVAPEPPLRRGRGHLLCYLGVMGPQDGVDVLLHALAALVHERGRRDVHAVLMGFGDSLPILRGLSRALGLDDWVEFTGPVDTAAIARYLSTADIGLCPDPKDAFNDVSTMNKTMEYMAFGLPVVAFDLTETRVSAGEAAVYVDGPSPQAFAGAVDALLDDERRRKEMGVLGRQRVERALAWHHQRRRYVDLYFDLLGRPAAPPRSHDRAA